MSSSAAVRFIAATKKSSSALGHLQIQLHVKPGANKGREGVAHVTDTAIELCVAAQPRDGEANKAVIQVLSKVLGVPKSRLSLRHGFKSRDKTVVLGEVEGDGQEFAHQVLTLLQEKSDATT